ncbi:hypothetical protein [Salipiger sp. PrR003]|uniref:hypothetical protein n=1 Tax=Salipiger sp. PrR003 TaxID=2706776 RepID=UPI0013DBEB86|nr:hypothetical protein [Salipiger sp. PrR003]NDV50135.1 hypothetical protein [Salipiger sp. PrR003]
MTEQPIPPAITPEADGWIPSEHCAADGRARWTREKDLLTADLSIPDGTVIGAVRLYRWNESVQHFDRVADALAAANEPRKGLNVKFQ